MSRTVYTVPMMLVCACALTPASGNEPEDKDQSGAPTMQHVREGVVRNNNQFAIELHRQVAAANASGNTVCSPASVSNVMGMLYAGASGETAREMAAVMHFRGKAEQLGRMLTLASPDRRRPRFSTLR